MSPRRLLSVLRPRVRRTMVQRRFVALIATAALLAQNGYVDPGFSRAAIDDGSGHGIWYVALTGTASPGTGTGCANPDYVAADYAGGASDALSAAIWTGTPSASAGDTVHLCGGTFDLSGGTVYVGKRLTLRGEGTSGTGPGATIVTSSVPGQLFEFQSGAVDATVGDMTITGARNIGYYRSGGAIASWGTGTLTLDGVEFDDNRVQAPTEEGWGFGRGGAVYATGNVSITDSTFTDNHANRGGGVIAAEGSVTIGRSTFTDNSAGTDGSKPDGGAIFARGAVHVEDSTFENSRTGSDGGAIRSDSDVSIERTHIANSSGFGLGGAVRGSKVTITDATFVHNTTVLQGGAVYASSVEAEGTQFEGNIATGYPGWDAGYGGAIYASGAVSITGGDFIDNTAGGASGGAFQADGATVIDGTDFLRNRAYVHGGAFYTNGTTTVSGATFTGNEAQFADGGAIFSIQQLAVDESTFRDNTAGSRGGAIIVNNGTPFRVATSLFDGNSAAYGGALWGYEGDPLPEISGSTFVDNRATQRGGAIWFHGYFTVRTSTFVENHADDRGGAIEVDGDYGLLQLYGSTLVGNTAPNYGHVYAGAATTRVENSIFGGGTCIVLAPGNATYDQRFNNLSDDSSCGLDVGDFADLRLGTLADNGGPLPTVAILGDSPAVDAADETSCLANTPTDQRGLARPIGDACDVGAYEYVHTDMTAQLYLRSVDGTPIAYGSPSPTSGDVVVDDVTVTGSLGYEPEGLVRFSYCQPATGLTYCSGGTEIAAVSLTEGTTPGDSTSGARIEWKPAGGWRVGSYLLRAAFEPSAGTFDGPAAVSSTATQLIRIVGEDYYAGDGSGLTGPCSAPDFSSGTLDDDLVRSAVDFAAEDGVGYNVIHLCPGTWSFDSAVSITTGDNSTGIEIVGAGATRDATVLTGNLITRHFTVDSSSQTIVRNLTLLDGVAPGTSGGSIHASGTGLLSIERVDLTSNTAALDGGAIWALGDVSVSDATFSRNHAENGGAIYSSAGSVSSTDGSYEYNGAIYDGGAIRAEASASSDDDEFHWNGAGNYGGAVFVDAGDVSSRDGLYADNSVTYYSGGAIYAAGGSVTSDTDGYYRNVANWFGGAVATGVGGVSSVNGTYHENTAGSFNGGAIDAVGDVTSNTDEFQRNYANQYGGAITSESGSVTSSGSDYLDNTANSGSGGAIYAATLVASVADDFTTNSAYTCGGAIGVGSGTASSSDGTYRSNQSRMSSGGAICASGSVTSFSDEFTANWASDSGGAIYSGAGSVSSTDGVYTENTANTSNGGAIRADTGPIASFGDEFHRNWASGYGGAIATYYGSVSSTEGTYEDNRADGYHGGAIYTVEGSVWSDTDSFDGNWARSQGGAIFSDQGSVHSSGGTYEHNTASIGFGGAIKAEGGVTSIRDEFTWNWSEGNGAAIWSNAGPVDVTSGVFGDNSANTGNGGAIYSGGSVSIDGTSGMRSSFTSNWSSWIGGAVYCFAGTVSAIYATFDGNVAAGADGGAIWAPGSVSVSSGEFSGNRAHSSGGAIYAGTGSVSSTDGVYTDNTADTQYGGAIRIDTGDLHSDTDEFDGNRASASGGAIFVNSGSVWSANGFYTDNSAATDSGGAIRTNNGDVHSATDEFHGNWANVSGGAISVAGADAFGVVESSNGTYVDNTANTAAGGAIVARLAVSSTLDEFTGNTALGLFAGGGAIWSDYGPVAVTGSTFDDNSAGSSNGGAIVSGSSVTVDGGTFRRNWASGDGGAIYAYPASVSTTDGIYEDNISGGSGGAISARQDVTVDGDEFGGNLAKYNGGAVIAGVGSVTSTDGTYEGNTATEGAGGAFFASTYVSSSTGDAFIGNTAGLDGGAIWAYESVTSTSGTFHDNSSGTNGGAIYARVAVTIDGTGSFTGNHAIQYGGAVYALVGPVTSATSTYVDNTCGDSGGAIAMRNGVVALDGDTFRRNRAGIGGGAILAGDLTGDRLTVEENTAGTADGGGLNVGGSVAVTASTFARNLAGVNGGAIGGAVNGLSLTNSTLVGNEASSGTGGALFVGGNATLVNVTLKDNTTRTGPITVWVAVGSITVVDSIFDGGSCAMGGSTPSGANFQTDPGASCFGPVVTSDDLRWGTFGPNGGPTDTVELLPGSVAIDPPGRASTQTEDQRGFPRPAGWGDSGAFERTSATHVEISGPAGPFQQGTAATYTVSVSSGEDEVTGGTLSLSDGTEPIGSCDLTSGTHGTCDFSTNSPYVGARTLVATYSGTSGESTWDADTSTFTVRVTPGPKTTYYVNPATYTLAGTGEKDGDVGKLLLDPCTVPDFGTIQDAIDFAETDSVTANTIHVCAGTYPLTSSVDVGTGDNTAGLTIEGDGSTNTILVASGVVQLLYVNNDGQDPLPLAIRDLGFTGGQAVNGGAIGWRGGAASGSLLLDSVELTGNTAISGGSGGALSTVTGVSLAIVGSRFAGNTAPGGNGGAIWTGSALAITDGTFEWNSAAGNGGVVYTQSTITSDPSLYKDNSAGSFGGVFYAEHAVTTLGDTFENNLAGIGGGAIYSEDTVSASDGTVFTENTAGSGDGGAIYAQDPVSVSDATFTDNSAGSDGGAIFATADINSTRSHFSGNVAADPSDNGFGGAIGTFGWSVVVDGGSFAGNRATGRGGAVHGYNLDVTGGTVFSDNTCGDAGGAIFSRYGADLRDLVFTDNSSGGWGGAVAVDDSALSVARSTFTGNVTGGLSTQGGGAIGLNGAATVEDSTFERNTALAGNGGAILSQYSTVTVQRSTFHANRAPYGGAIKSAGAATATNSTFLENTAATYGGAINASDVTLVYVTLKDDTAGTGGHVYATGTITITQTILAGGTCSVVPASATGANFATDPSCVTTGVTSVTSGDLKLATLRKSGRSLTATLALRRGSVAIDPVTGQTTCDVATDQRGIARPQGVTCDAGAFERTGLSRITIETLDNPVRFGQAAPRFHVSVTTGEGGTEVTGGTVLLYEIVPGTLDTPQRQYVATPCTLTPEKHGACDFTTGVDPRLYFVGRHRLMATYSGQGDPELDPEGAIDPSQTTGDQYVIRNGTQLLYTGETYVAGGVGYTYAAALGDITAGSGCATAGRTIGFYRGYSDGTYEPTPFATATTNGSGVATTTADLSTANNGINEVLIEYGGGSDCEPAVTTATILVDSSGGTSSGGGHYVVPGAGRVNFAYRLNFTTTKVRGVDVSSTSGDIVWHSNGKFRMKGTITAYTKLTSCPTTTLDGRAQSYSGPGGGSTTVTCGYFAGTGTLYMWVSLNGVSRWLPIGTGIGFQVTVGDGGESPAKGNGKSPGSNSGKGGGKDYTDWFRMNIPAAFVTGESAGLEPLKGGNLAVR